VVHFFPAREKKKTRCFGTQREGEKILTHLFSQPVDQRDTKKKAPRLLRRIEKRKNSFINPA